MSRLGHYEVHFWCSKLELKLLITKYYQQHFYPNCMSQLPTITPFSAQFEFGLHRERPNGCKRKHIILCCRHLLSSREHVKFALKR